MVRYPVVLQEDDNDTWLVAFPNFPEAHTFGEDEADALRNANNALATVVDAYIRDRRPLPVPSAIKNMSAELPPLMSAKVEIYNAMLLLGVTKSDLGRRLNWHPPQVDRLLNLSHGSGVDQLADAARALGGSLQVTLTGIPSEPQWFTRRRPQPVGIAASSTIKGEHKVRRPATRKK